MSKLSFTKFHGAGNDFILIDDRALNFNPNKVPYLCQRKFGIGADGVILLQEDEKADFRMRIFNADGSEAESCGNGLRCLMKFLCDLGFPKRAYRIRAGTRMIEAYFIGERIAVQMGSAQDVKRQLIEGIEVHSLNTGVPHAVVFADLKLEILGPMFERHSVFLPQGTNVSVAKVQGNAIRAKTFERGVGETLSCGTAAAAIGYLASTVYRMPNPIRICMPGGELMVSITRDEITLIGDAVKVFDGYTENLE